MDDDPTIAIRPARQEALPAVLHDAIARRLQRQHLQAVADSRHPLQAQHRRRPRSAGQSLRLAVHPAVLSVFRAGRPVRREVRQGRADPQDKARRDLHHARRGCRGAARQPAADARRAVRHGHAVGAVRPGEVFDPAAAPAGAGAGGGQRAGGNGHLPGDPRGHHRCRGDDGQQQLRAHRRRFGGGGGGARLPGQPGHSQGLGGHAGVAAGLEHLPPVLGDHETRPGPAPGGVALAGGQLLVLVSRRDLPDADSGLLQGVAVRRRERGDADPHRVLAGHRPGVDAVRADERAQGGDRPGAVRLHRPDPVRHPALVVLRRLSAGRRAARLAGAAGPWPGLVDPRLHPRHRPVRRLLHRAAVCADPVAHGGARAGAGDRCQQHPQCAVHGGVGHRRDSLPQRRRAVDSAAVPGGVADEHRGQQLHLQDRPRVQHALSHLAARAFDVPGRAQGARGDP